MPAGTVTITPGSKRHLMFEQYYKITLFIMAFIINTAPNKGIAALAAKKLKH